MKRPLIDTALEKQLLSRREPHRRINLTAFGLAGADAQPRNNTEILMDAISEEKYLDTATEPLPFDYFIQERVSPV